MSSNDGTVLTDNNTSNNTCISKEQHDLGSKHRDDKISGDDKALLELADKLMETDRLLEAARGLEKVQNKSLLDERHHKILAKAESIHKTVQDHNDDIEEWTKRFESHRNNRDTIISFRVHDGKDENPSSTSWRKHLTTRIETPVEPSLLVPLLAVLGESQLYETWMPKFQKPFKPGLSSATKLSDVRPPNLLLSLKIELPWPFWTREVVLDVQVCDDIDTSQQLIVKLDTLKDDSAPPLEQGVVRAPSFDGGLLFRKCPPDHPALVNTKSKQQQQQRQRQRPAASAQEHKKNHLVLVSMTVSYLPDIPVGLIVHRVAWGRLWSKLLDISQAVRDGKRPDHSAAIEQKQDLYDWVEERVGIMLKGME